MQYPCPASFYSMSIHYPHSASLASILNKHSYLGIPTSTFLASLSIFGINTLHLSPASILNIYL